MPIIAITREMGSLGKDVARGLGEALSLPVIRLLDGSAGLFERLTADKTSLAMRPHVPIRAAPSSAAARPSS